MRRQANQKQARHVFIVLAMALICASLIVGFPIRRTVETARAQSQDKPILPDVPIIPPGSAYRQTNFITDVPGLAPVLDPLLANPWGIAVRGTSPFWIANNGTSTTQLVRGDVGSTPLTLNPSAPQTITIPGGLPTGIVSNSTSDFQITPPGGGSPAASSFIFASENGNITAWNGAQGTTAKNAVSLPGHKWTGLAIGSNAGGNRLYAADFINNHIDVFDGTFTATTVAGGFIDPSVSSAYHVFNIQNLGGSLYVTYAKYDAGTQDSVDAPGEGLVRKFTTDGFRDLTFAISVGGPLNSPWGLAIAPAPFGIFGNALLVGNFAALGNINAFNAGTGLFLGTLKSEANENIVIDGLWALQFGNGVNGGDLNTLYFSAGLGEEEHGLFGKLNPTTVQATSLIQFATDNFSVDEAGGHVDFTVVRTGDTTAAASIHYNTFDESQPGHASQKSDYELAAGTLTFNPGETSKSFRIFVVNDTFAEGDEVVDLYLSNPTAAPGVAVGLGSPSRAELKILDNDSVPPVTNIVDDPAFFVRQHYLDFYNREPDAGAAALISQLTACGVNQPCMNNKRVDVSKGFLTSPDFLGNGSLIARANKAAFGANPNTVADMLYGQFEIDYQALMQGVTIGAPADPQLETNKQAFFTALTNRPEFKVKYDSLTDAQYVDTLLINAGISPSDFVVSLTNSQEVPPTNPTTSTNGLRPRSFGSAHFQINGAETAMTMSTTVNNIDVNGGQSGDTNDNLAAAHIHAGPSVMPGVNGPVVWGFFGAPFNDNNPDDHVVTPFGGAVGGTFTDKWDAPEGNGTTLAAQLPNIRAGHAYINFHTVQFPGGEIRGNFPATQPFRDNLVAGLAGATETRATVLRKIAENANFAQTDANRDLLQLGFFGYYRRDPDTAGFNKLLGILNNFGGDALQSNIVRDFITSAEYRFRFGSDSPFNINSAPIANSETVGTNSLTTIFVNVLLNDIDPDGDFLMISSVTPGTGGTPTIAPDRRSVNFTPSPGFAGTANFQYTITDNGVNSPGIGAIPNPLFATATVTVIVASAGTFQFSSPSYGVGEGVGKLTVTVTRNGDSTVPVSVNYATSDTAGLSPCSTVSGAASSRCDYETAVGTLSFAAGEVSKTFDLLVINDVYVEGPETLTLTLSNPVGTNFTLGTPSTATFTITDDDSAAAPNPIDDPAFFVRQHYLDFLNREPDPAGLAGWISTLTTCPAGNQTCDRIAVSQDFYLSDEFQSRGYFIYRFYSAALGRKPTYLEFMSDLSRLSGFQTPAQLEASKVAFIADFMNRTEFKNKYDAIMDPTLYVKALEQTAGVTLANEATLISGLQTMTETRATVLRKVIESPEVAGKFFNEAFVVEAYFGYLRRDPDVQFQVWIQGLNQTGDRRNVVNGFVNSDEYRKRFGP